MVVGSTTIAAASNPDGWVIKLDSSGTVITVAFFHWRTFVSGGDVPELSELFFPVMIHGESTIRGPDIV